MGYVKETIQLVSNILDDGQTIDTMLELGNQYIFPNGNTEVNGYRLGNHPGSNVAKHYFAEKYPNLAHTSVDYNGQDGALKIDLSIPKALSFTGPFDIVTNLGTLEHVGEGKSDKNAIFRDQYEAFKNVHNSLSQYGIWFNLAPKVGSWPGHCPSYYTVAFFQKLLELNNYIMIRDPEEYTYSNPVSEMFVLFIASKRDNSEFISFDKFNELKDLMEIVL